MLLSGHSGEIYTAKFHPEGNILASGGFDRQICKRKKLKKPKPAVVSAMSHLFQSFGTCTGSATTSTSSTPRTLAPSWTCTSARLTAAVTPSTPLPRTRPWACLMSRRAQGRKLYSLLITCHIVDHIYRICLIEVIFPMQNQAPQGPHLLRQLGAPRETRRAHDRVRLGRLHDQGVGPAQEERGPEPQQHVPGDRGHLQRHH